MTDTKPTLEASTKDICEWVLHYYGYQPANMSQTEKRLYKLAGEFAAIKSQPVPVEPDVWEVCGEKWVRKEGYDSLQSALQVAQQERDDAERMVKNLAPTGRYNGLDIEQWMQRAKKAEAERNDWENKAGQYMDERDKAEERNKRLVELLKEAQKTVNDMRSEHKMHGHITDASAHWAIKIEPELLREAGK